MNTMQKCMGIIMLSMLLTNCGETDKKPAIQIGGEIVYTVPEKDFYPEGITYDPVEKAFYLGSLKKNKIIKISEAGVVTDFVHYDPEFPIHFVGMKVDRNSLWVCWVVMEGPLLEGVKEENYGKSGIVRYDLSSGELQKNYLLEDVLHILNDIEIDANGNVYITDTETGELYLIDPEKDELEVFVTLPEKLNGISFNADKSRLYVAGESGIFAVDVSNKEHFKISHSESIETFGSDGLYFYENSLVGVQNMEHLNRIARFYLNEAGDSVESMKVLNDNFPENQLATTGVIVDGHIYLTYTTLWPPYSTEMPKHPVIVKVSLQ